MSLRRRAVGRWAVVVGAVTVLAACTPPSLDEVRPSRFVAEPEVSQEATELFGEHAEQAYDQLAELLMDEGFALHADPAADPVALLVDPLAPAMTADTLDYWRRTAEEAVHGDRAARDVIDLLRITDLHDPEIVARDVVSQMITDGRVDVARGGQGALVVELEQQAVISADRLHRSEEVTVVRSLRTTLVPDEDQRWELSEFRGDVDWTFGG